MKDSLAKSGGRPPIVRAYLDTELDTLDIGADELIADSFAGGGGASTGIELGLGRSPDLAVNHDPEAIAMHAANHPDTEHHITSVWEVDPRVACRGRRVALAWFSPDCKHHSKAKGGKPREQKIRGLAWVAVTWAQRVKPRVIALENVEEFQHWGPLHRHTDGCTGETRERRIDGRARETTGCRKSCKLGQPIKARKGETFRAFVRKLERLGYVVEWRLLRASDYGAPTSRRRLFLVARSGPIVSTASSASASTCGLPSRGTPRALSGTMSKSTNFGPTEIHYADACVQMGRVIGRVMTNADRSVFRLLIGDKVHAGWRGSWDGFMECAQSGAPFQMRYRFVSEIK